jgi:hypothetical protein
MRRSFSKSNRVRCSDRTSVAAGWPACCQRGIQGNLFWSTRSIDSHPLARCTRSMPAAMPAACCCCCCCCCCCRRRRHAASLLSQHGRIWQWQPMQRQMTGDRVPAGPQQWRPAGYKVTSRVAKPYSRARMKGAVEVLFLINPKVSKHTQPGHSNANASLQLVGCA